MTNTTEVEYREIEGFPGHRVGSDGSVWSRWVRISLGYGRGTRYILGPEWRRGLPSKSKEGYLRVSLHRDGGGKRFLVHRLVLTVFVGPPPEGMQGCHYDGDPANNRLTNLRWDTCKNNNADKVRHGTHNRGERHLLAKLTTTQVLEIREKYAAGGVTQRQLAKEYGVHQSNISIIFHHRRWSYKQESQ